MVSFTVIRSVVLPSSKIIYHFGNSQLIFTWHKMASMYAKFHCHTISSLENTRVGHLCLPTFRPPQNKIGLRKNLFSFSIPMHAHSIFRLSVCHLSSSETLR